MRLDHIMKGWTQNAERHTDRIGDPTRVAAKVVGMEDGRARSRQTAASGRRGDHSARRSERDEKASGEA
jgi:hypothetical protein